MFKRLSDSREGDGIDTIMDFAQGEDKIDLRRIDASRKMGGDQAFVLADDGAPGTGELGIRIDASTGMTVIEGNVDDDQNSELIIYLAGEHTLTSDDFML